MNQKTETEPHVQGLLSLLNEVWVKDRFKALAKEHLTAERMLFLAIECVRNNPALGECDHLSVLGAFITAQSLGLEPNTPLGHAYLIPYKGWTKDDQGNWKQKQAECSFQIGYRGFAQLFHRTGKVVTCCARAIRENDTFHHEEGTNMVVRYSKALQSRGKVIGSFCHINKLNGGQDFELLTLEDIEQVRSTSETYKSLVKSVEQAEKKNNKLELDKAKAKLADTPWVKWEDIMCAKPAIKRLAKVSDLDTQVSIAAEIDSLSDVGQADFKAVVDAKDEHEVFDAFSAQQQRAALPQPSDKPIPTLDLGGKPEAQPVTSKSNGNSTKQPLAQPDGPPPGHPASFNYGGF